MLVPEYESEITKLYNANKDLSKEQLKARDTGKDRQSVEQHNGVINRVLEGFNQHLDDCRDEIAEKGYINVIDDPSSLKEKEISDKKEGVMDVESTKSATTVAPVTAVTQSNTTSTMTARPEKKGRKRSSMFGDIL